VHHYGDFQANVIGWIADWRGEPDIRLAADTRINCGPNALGIDGDDALDLLGHLARRSGISLKTFEYDRFFGPEALPWRRIFDWIKGGRQCVCPLTIAMLSQYMWDEAQSQNVTPIIQ
jgi:hypothetical protein